MRHRLIILCALVCVVGAGAGIWTVSASHHTARADTISTVLSGSAYGLAITATSGAANLSAGPIGEVTTDCNPDPTNQENTHLGVNLFHGLLNSTTIKDDLTFAHSDYTSTAIASSTIANVTIGRSLLGPLVEINGLHAEAHSTAKIGTATSDTAHSSFDALRIAGVNLPLNIPPNTHIALPTLGSIVLNEQITQNINPINSYAVVNMVDITLGLGNVLNAPVGTHIIIGHAVSLDSAVSVLAGLHSHASGLYTTLLVKKLASIQLGPIPDTEIGCTGGTNSATGLDLSVPLLVNSGIAQTTATGSVNGSNVTASSSEKITNLNILNGRIRVKSLQETAQAVFNGTGGAQNCELNMQELNANGSTVQPEAGKNVRVNLPGLGYLIINEQVPTSYTIGCAVNALDIYVTTPNTFQLAVGLHIVIGHVDAGITLFH